MDKHLQHFFGDCVFYFVCEDEKVVNFHATFTVIKMQ